MMSLLIPTIYIWMSLVLLPVYLWNSLVLSSIILYEHAFTANYFAFAYKTYLKQ
jgi:hypothetical protein